MSRNAGFVFDMDGTLLDSEPAHLMAWRAAIARNGGDPRGLTDDEFAKWIGSPDVTGFAKSMVEQLGLGPPASTDPGVLADWKQEAFVAVAEANPGSARIFDGVPAAVQSVQDAGFKTHLCTGSFRAATEALLAGSSAKVLKMSRLNTITFPRLWCSRVTSHITG